MAEGGDKLKLLVIILNFNSYRDTINLYRLINDFLAFRKSILIVDNNSNKIDQELLKKEIPSKNLIINKKNKGYGSGNNIGLKKAVNESYDYALILNPDIRLEEKTILELLKELEKDSELVAVGPRICFRNQPELIYSDGGLVNASLGFRSSHLNYKKNVKDKSLLKKTIDYINGSCLMVRISSLKNIGMFLDTFFLYYEETEWCLRAKQLGYKIKVNTNVIAYHSTSNKNGLYHFYMTRNRLLIAKRFNKYFWRTTKIVLMGLIKESKNVILSKKQRSPFLIKKFKGFISGIFSKIERYEGVFTLSKEQQ
ncbi:glycosyltransferase family 2 protein [Seonamhaeicola aphaedonensis]|uniref:GT2 family glycosyltransferase n=1 Tax=Seonamhaeicola aphaedonensis TaxID=1461338 RepID=A0A3D9HG07_9FLAO|nr:glycosyltransferase family 2 protein [Seonamhaeicola aphaedonensis]RED48365.1 GT2 family glycosyltransferase [Seonamhaeicola aphaedonensis]